MSRAVMEQARDALAKLLDDAKLVSSGTMAAAALTTYMIDAEDAIAALDAALAESQRAFTTGEIVRMNDAYLHRKAMEAGRVFTISLKGIPRVDAKTKARLEAASRTPGNSRRDYPQTEQPLSPPSHRGPSGTGTYFDAWSADQMRDYARDVEAAALERMGVQR